VTIFWPGSPLHDGGVVLRGDRVAAAACIFPLAERRELASTIGTRHRAGLGLSEESDAVVVIVSEETGRISIAYQGELRTVPPSELKEVLLELLGPEGPPQQRGRRLGEQAAEAVGSAAAR
jgi:diadenylate cyclase